jgi:hypothetical protein
VVQHLIFVNQPTGTDDVKVYQLAPGSRRMPEDRRRAAASADMGLAADDPGPTQMFRRAIGGGSWPVRRGVQPLTVVMSNCVVPRIGGGGRGTFLKVRWWICLLKGKT